MRALPPWTCLAEGKFVALPLDEGCRSGYHCTGGVADSVPEKRGEQAVSPPRAPPWHRNRSAGTKLQNLGFMASVGKSSSLLSPNFAFGRGWGDL